MSDATIIDGKAFAAGLRARLADQVARLKEAHGITPGLSVVLVGEDPASQVYVRNKGRATDEAGMEGQEIRMPATATVRATRPTRCLVWPAGELRRLLTRNPTMDVAMSTVFSLDLAKKLGGA